MTDWRDRIPAQLKGLVSAWREPAAWDGVTEAGGVSMLASVMAVVALDELVIHCWDLAVATGQQSNFAAADLAVLIEFLRDTPPEGAPGLFGPVVPVPADASVLHRILGRTGRDPGWIA
ncbi:TIGR03086 family metal-binding protein [Nocardia sp. NPDC049220]|uniref:TIGR03086 family metal-binding protein n=1 Tax=Nocardia sp. NPDC049220 TaxID=3155273 RepID=UPI0033C0A281